MYRKIVYITLLVGVVCTIPPSTQPNAALSQNIIQPIPNLNVSQLENLTKACDKSMKLQVKCTEDCSGLEYCMNGRIFSINCMEQTGKKYCDLKKNECSDKLEICYNNADFCPNDGTYPDLINCQRYINCNGETMHSYQCEYDMVYDYRTKACLFGIPCITYSHNTGCGGTSSNFIVKHQNPRWFVICNHGKPILGECPGTTYTFDEEIGICRFQCGVVNKTCYNGKCEDEFIPSKYYICNKLGRKWQTIEKRCPPNTVFNKLQQVCTDDPNINDASSNETNYDNLPEHSSPANNLISTDPHTLKSPVKIKSSL